MGGDGQWAVLVSNPSGLHGPTALTIAQDSTPGGLEGNKTRNLWKKACRALARNVSMGNTFKFSS